MQGLRARWLNLSLARKGMVVAAIPVLTILLASIPIAINDSARVRENDAISRAHDALESAMIVKLDMKEAESRVFAFVASGDSAHLARFRAAAAHARRVLIASDTLNTEQQVHALNVQVRFRVTELEGELSHHADATRRTPTGRALTDMFVNEGKMAALFRQDIDRLIDLKTALLEQRRATLATSSSRRAYLAGLVILLGVLATGVSAALYTSGVAARVEHLQQNAAAIPEANANPQRVSGLDELGQLAAAIEENRKETARIADRLRTAIRSAHIEVVELRPEHDLITVVGSGNVFRRMGYTVDEIPTKFSTLIDTIHPEDRENVEHALETLRPGSEFVVEFRMQSGESNWRWMELRGASAPPVPEAEVSRPPVDESADNKPAAIGILLDVTERRTAEEQVRLAMTAADRANRAKSDFLSRMSHELRTPLNAVLGFAQLLEIEALSADQRESVSHILRGGRYLLNLINEVLDLARIEAGRLGLSIEPVAMREVVSAVVALIGPQATEFGVRLHASPPPGSFFALADRQRLQQVLLNLLSNAIKYNRRGGSVDLELSKSHGKVRVSVKDTGPGMSPDQLDKLFQPFERLDAARSGVEGTGLGLALSRTIVEAMGGRIIVESRPGSGSVFTVELDEAENPDELFDTLETEAAPEGQVTVLYVEDNQANVRLVERVVARRPRLRLVTIAEGDRALDVIRAENPALVLLDLNLPGMSGDLILRHLRQDLRTATLPVAILSADATPSQVDRLLSLGAQFYLTKPIDVGSLLQVLDSAIADDVQDGKRPASP